LHIQTHIMSGWCIANLLPLSPRERLFCMVAATIPDLDGLGILVSDRWYAWYHHVLGHNFTVGIAISLLLAAFSTHRILACIAYLGLFHLHLLMDYYGSGPGWAITYWWPWRTGPGSFFICDHPWEFYSWQNLSAAAFFLAWTLAIIWLCRRTPLEAIMPQLDKKMVRAIAGPSRKLAESADSLTKAPQMLSE